MSFLHIMLSIKDSVQQQIHYNGNIFWNKCCRCNEGLLYRHFRQMKGDNFSFIYADASSLRWIS